MKTEEPLSSVWEKHVGAEFAAKSADQALETMTADPYVNEVPLMIGARGRRTARLLRQPFPEPDPAGPGDGSCLADHRAGPGGR